MSKRFSRRTFLKTGVAAAACSIASIAPAVKAAEALGSGEPIATLLDISKCIGCEECVHACREANQDRFPAPQKPFPEMFPKRVPVMDWSEKRDVTDRLTPYNWLYIQYATVEINGEEKELTIPRRCMHCVNPPCVKLCPWGAARQYKNGISQIDANLCLGGSKCKSVCPWLIPERQTGVGLYLDILPTYAGNGVMYKCDRCYEKVIDGELPACIEVCPEEVQTIGPRSEIIKQAHTLASETNGFIYGEHENGGTNTFYVSPVPFEELNNAIEKGSGKPHLKSVTDTMAAANNLTKAMLLAPLAGIAAAFGKFYMLSKEKK